MHVHLDIYLFACLFIYFCMHLFNYVDTYLFIYLFIDTSSYTEQGLGLVRSVKQIDFGEIIRKLAIMKRVETVK